VVCADVPHIHFDHFFERDTAAAVHLPDPGDAGGGLESLHVMSRVPLDLVQRYGAGSHEAHLAPEHIQDLGELVVARAPDEPAYSRHPVVFIEFEGAPGATLDLLGCSSDECLDVLAVPGLVCPVEHRSKLQEFELTRFPRSVRELTGTHPCLSEERRSGRI